MSDELKKWSETVSALAAMAQQDLISEKYGEKVLEKTTQYVVPNEETVNIEAKLPGVGTPTLNTFAQYPSLDLRHEWSGGGWTEEWPTEPGLYLLYGRPAMLRKPNLYVVRAAFDATGRIMCSGGGVFIYREETKGLWKRFTDPLPELPEHLK